MRSVQRWLCGLGLVSLAVGGAHASDDYNFNPRLKEKPSCKVPFPHEAMRLVPAGFKGETLVLITFNVEGKFMGAVLMRSSGKRELDDAALHAAVSARCEPLADTRDRTLDDALIGIPFTFTFDNSHLAPAEVLPVQ